ncbi:membrane transporter [Schizosaccharomyces japonicus yFS275]|uniref:Membrane transporter n=1 Tax=Schizosaccharomyces japonicus (strain yFS275 / FY16936) TaxID=402676 RepID=B6K3F4_SCHJY|nr:membrane transporter [Schizosaccharomyces japonicus yFS275]EEB08011.1 membrane transporter [Schizosaccharomyces japonicus yFS275]
MQRRLVGIILLLLVVFLWLASSFLTSDLLNDSDYSKPFFITYLNTGTFVFYLIPWYFKRRKAEKRRLTSDVHLYESVRSENDPFQANPPPLTEKLDVKHTAYLSAGFCVLWFSANYFSNASLGYTNVASFTIISSLSGFFTLGLGAIANVERFSVAKFCALLASVAGVILVSVQDGKQADQGVELPTKPILGDTYALMAAFLYGCYSVLIKFHVHDEEHISMHLFFGLVGLFDLLFLWPIMIFLHNAGVEVFELPSDLATTVGLSINASITFVSDYLWVIAMLMTSPLVVTLGMSLSIPLALICDILFKDHYTSVSLFIGSFLVFVGFIIVNSKVDP